jgi:hypothetical protein
VNQEITERGQTPPENDRDAAEEEIRFHLSIIRIL